MASASYAATKRMAWKSSSGLPSRRPTRHSPGNTRDLTPPAVQLRRQLRRFDFGYHIGINGFRGFYDSDRGSELRWQTQVRPFWPLADDIAVAVRGRRWIVGLADALLGLLGRRTRGGAAKILAPRLDLQNL